MQITLSNKGSVFTLSQVISGLRTEIRWVGGVVVVTLCIYELTMHLEQYEQLLTMYG